MTATYTAAISGKNGRPIISSTGHPDRESAVRALFEIAPLKHRECSAWRGHGMDIRWHARPRRTFEEATARRDELDARVDAASAVMQTFPRAAMNLIPDAVRTSPECVAARAEMFSALEALRLFNVVYVAEFPREIRAARDARRQARADNLARLSGAPI